MGFKNENSITQGSNYLFTSPPPTFEYSEYSTQYFKTHNISPSTLPEYTVREPVFEVSDVLFERKSNFSESFNSIPPLEPSDFTVDLSPFYVASPTLFQRLKNCFCCCFS